MRLQKYISGCGVCSRRKAEELIALGRVSVNGIFVTEMGFIIDPVCDAVLVDGKRIEPERAKVYILLNKPRGYITSVKDQFGRKTVLDLVDVKEHLFPVGRLDYDTEGLLLLTNDGDFAQRLIHPKYKIEKTYIAETKGVPTPEDLNKLREGIYIDGYKTAGAKAKLIKSDGRTAVLSITIMEGRNRQIRKMCEHIDLKVVGLKRVRFGSLTLHGLPVGHWRGLTESELNDYRLN